MAVSDAPLVSIGLLCYNTGKYVVESLDCVKRQNYPNVELIIIDDCSTDEVSVSHIKEWLNQNQDLGYKTYVNFRQKNEGVHAGLNEILDKSTGKYLTFISDDLWSDDKLIKQVDHLEKLGDEYALYYGKMLSIDKDSQLLKEEKHQHYFPDDNELPKGDIFAHCINNFSFWIQSCTIRLDLLKKINFKFNKNYISEDWHLILGIARNYKIYGNSNVSAYYRWLENSITRQLWQEKNMHNIYFSQFDMIFSFLNHSKNNSLDNLVITKKLMNLLLGINCYNYIIKWNLLRKYFLLVSQSKNKRYLIERFSQILKTMYK
ncbi:glycosyltransferase family 2 protein [Chryseobacterium luquanense]|uniref:Glycosyltransferase family 2 protein n=1 Tax=Chryseobacterium luquanense TaxID=2983766 RepID=A0ABT3Y655_9FLAO|nr:glycosyltransferase family 2 protein [Chryseobacterium luquanense]MCX8533635.1 glycosyltransferase family 2 protein [Chryseobacterium luquanense]